MERRKLGCSGLQVSRFCLGTLTMGPLQKNMAVVDGADLIVHAVKQGINIIDTAELYLTYPYIRLALQQLNKAERPLIISKSYAYTAQQMQDSIERACQEMDVDTVDVFLMHEQESLASLRGHREAFAYLQAAKSAGLIKAAGISCHTIEAVRAATKLPGVDVIMPIINLKGIGIIDGNLQEMLSAIKEAHEQGIGIVAMKVLAGGHLIPDSKQALDFARECGTLDTIAIGAQSTVEIDYNLALLAGIEPLATLELELSKKSRSLFIEPYCTGCGLCVKRCSARALTIINNMVQVDSCKCRLCGYCATVCPGFYIKVL